MTLREYLRKNDISNQDFADQIEVSIFAVRKWLSGERIPRDKTKVRIARVTKNAVPTQVWLGQ